jgi:ATP-dependent DNA helicase RecQ
MHDVEALRNAFRKNTPDGLLFDKPSVPQPPLSSAIWRFLKAWSDNSTLGPDHAVLLRQIARWSEGEWHLGSIPTTLSTFLARSQTVLSVMKSLRARPFRPSWLAEDVLPDAGIDGIPSLRFAGDPVRAESYVTRLGFESWRSSAQKEAAWMALSAHPGQTTLIVLPTGMGKCLCFQLLPLFSSGLTIVVVPTVALAIDQWRSAESVFRNVPGVNPLYFAAQDPDIDPAYVVHSIAGGQCRIVFTSPEACVSGRLRWLIEETAADGRLANLVIDEAHLIDTWGAFFRVDFQVLAGLRRRWLQRSNGRIRTLLLSATITPSCRSTLKELFPSYGTASDKEFLYQQLRPEMVYYDRVFDSEPERDAAVIECIWQLPRPAIVYTTEVDEAKALYERIRVEQGFVRLGCFHGDTPPRTRRQLLTQWRNDEIDLMVATSAFGLGVDKPDIRAVIHACYPENLNRYFQEVGRGGRDGYSSICLLLPTKQDYHIAKGLSPKLMREDSIQQRWEALWKSRNPINEDDYRWELCLNSKRQTLVGVRTWSENVRWNKRLILQLRRAQKIDLLNARYDAAEDEDSDPTEWVEVQLKTGFAPDSPRVGDSITEQRNEELANSRLGLDQIDAYHQSSRCISRILRTLYGDGTRRVCGGCRWCRREGRPAGLLPRVEFEVVAQRDVAPRIAIVENCPAPDASHSRDLAGVVRRCIEQKGIHRFAAANTVFTSLFPVVTSAFAYRGDQHYRLDDVDRKQPFLLNRNEQIVVFHFGEIEPSAAGLDRGGQVVHLLGKGLSFQDIRYQLPKRCTNPNFYADIEQWFM